MWRSTRFPRRFQPLLRLTGLGTDMTMERETDMTMGQRLRWVSFPRGWRMRQPPPP